MAGSVAHPMSSPSIKGTRRAGVGRASSPPNGPRFGRERAGPVRTNFQRCVLEDLRSAYLSDACPERSRRERPRGGDNRGLLVLYKQASSGECPLAIVTSTSFCDPTPFRRPEPADLGAITPSPPA